MIITGISAASSTDHIRQGQATTPATTLPGIVQAPAATRAAPLQPSGEAHRRGGGEVSEPSFKATQSRTNAMNIFNTLR
jgi:hypothetical protein